jgi:hypothetical protein
MFRFHPLFWLIVALAWIFASRRRRWFRYWSTATPMGYPPEGPFGWGQRGYSRDPRWGQQPQMPAAPQPLAQPDRTLVESLESRIAELETRLEFAERLMSSRKDDSPKA